MLAQVRATEASAAPTPQRAKEPVEVQQQQQQLQDLMVLLGNAVAAAATAAGASPTQGVEVPSRGSAVKRGVAAGAGDGRGVGGICIGHEGGPSVDDSERGFMYSRAMLMVSTG